MQQFLGRVTKEDDWECIKIHQGTEGVMTNLQSTVFDEADLRIAVHVLEALKEGHTVCVVISSDTDVIVTLLYHMPVYVQHGIQELWVKAGVGDTTRFIPLHTLFQS